MAMLLLKAGPWPAVLGGSPGRNRVQGAPQGGAGASGRRARLCGCPGRGGHRKPPIRVCSLLPGRGVRGRRRPGLRRGRQGLHRVCAPCNWAASPAAWGLSPPTHTHTVRGAQRRLLSLSRSLSQTLRGRPTHQAETSPSQAAPETAAPSLAEPPCPHPGRVLPTLDGRLSHSCLVPSPLSPSLLLGGGGQLSAAWVGPLGASPTGAPALNCHLAPCWLL